jgi:anti-anti-sigma factor
MQINVSQEQGRVPVTVFQIHGEITADTAGQFTSAAQTAIDEGTRNLLLDLSDVPYIASFGIRALSDVLKMLHEAGSQSEADLRQALRDGKSRSKHLKLLKPNPQVVKVLETTGIDLLLEVYTDQRKAIASFA